MTSKYLESLIVESQLCNLDEGGKHHRKVDDDRGMARTRIWMNDVTEGMKLSRDVLTRDGQLLVGKNTIITSRIILRLKFYSVPFVYIEEQEVGQPKEPSYYKKIEATPEFKRFDHTLRAGVESLQNTLNQAILYNEEVDSNELLANIDKIVEDAGNSMHLVNMLQCIRSYDDLTYVHSVNVALISNIMADWLHMSEEDKKILTIAGLLHDVGKTVIPNEILTKKGKLTAEEYQMLQSHVLKGYELIKDRNLDERIKLAVLLHHERCDGTGYPFGMRGDSISDFAKIISIADVYDAMTSNRVYRQGICPFDVIETFEKEGYQKYDPKFLLPFLERISQCYIHANVMLSNGQEGEVIMLNKNHLSKPVVKIEDDYIDLAENNTLSIQTLL